MAATASYVVVGMSCEHCVRAVEEEVGALQGVRAVEVDLTSGRLAVTTADAPDAAAVRAAVAEAGYELT